MLFSPEAHEQLAGGTWRRRAEFGQGRHTVWTGDPGTALFLGDCIDGGGRLASSVTSDMSIRREDVRRPGNPDEEERR